MNFLKERKGFLSIVATFILLLLFFIVRLVVALHAAETSSEKFQSLSGVQMGDSSLWRLAEYREAQKEIYWLEQHLVLAKNDSISLAVNLADSMVQIQLKGMDLFHSRILKHYPEHYLISVNQDVYRQLASVGKIRSESANVPKKPIKKVKAPKNGIAPPEVKNRKMPNPELNWSFMTDTHLRVVINGVKMSSDSTFAIQPWKDLTKNRIHELVNDVFPSEYAPSLYLWLSDRDAKAIYRAVPEQGNVLFRN